MATFKTKFDASNYAPLKNLKGEIDGNSLEMSIYADNGEGKTFISKAFRMTEMAELPLSDKYLSFGESKGTFSFSIATAGTEVDKFEIQLDKGSSINCSSPKKFIFHTFNQEYIDENIRSISFDKKKDHIDGYIIGKAKIDLKEDEDKLATITDSATKKHTDIQTYIDNALKSIGGITNIRRIQEYSTILTKENIFLNYKSPIQGITKTVAQYTDEYDLIKSIPENPVLIKEVIFTSIDSDLLNTVNLELQKELSLSSIADDFKQKVKSKQLFIEEGLKLVNKTSTCPFCEQILKDDSLNLIDNYITYFNEEEAKYIKVLNDYIQQFRVLKQSIEKCKTNVLSEKSLASDYIVKYIPSFTDRNLSEIDTKGIIAQIDGIIKSLENKVNNITLPISIDTYITEINIASKAMKAIISQNNQNAIAINQILNDSAETNRNIRRNICKALFNEIISHIGSQIDECIELTRQKDEITTAIKEKKKASSVKKLDKVSETIKTILNAFFRGKYTFDDEKFLLQCKGNSLAAGEASHVLSEGEKSIIAFAYYLGDVFVKVNDEDDYEKLFFVIDDPISSMDFNYVYVLSTIIRELKQYIPIKNHLRILLLTHNLEFMRIIVGNRIIPNCYLLKNNQLKRFATSWSVPYISHLHDIYRISIKTDVVSHTTANSIRHILESLLRFENPNQQTSLEDYIRNNLPDDKYTYTLIQDLSHGAMRSEIPVIKEEDYSYICEYVISFINNKYPGQIEYCKTYVAN